LKPEDKKYVWWALLGIGVAALFYFLSAKNQSSQNANTVTVPYLVPQTTTGASPTADTSLSTQQNIVGSSPNSTIDNFTNPYAVAANPFEAPGTWGFMPNLQMSGTQLPQNQVAFGAFTNTSQTLPNAVSQANSPTHA
jgi:hypothetical protein